MAFAECKTGVITLLRTLTVQFPSSNQVATNSRILDDGVMNAALVYKGGVRRGRYQDQGPAYERVWEVIVKLHRAFTEEQETIDAFEALCAAVILKIDENPTLGGVTGVSNAEIVSEGDPYLSTPEPIYLVQDFRVSISQYLRVT